jgi:NADPH:quinone reductase-like Zn-dependent oxidoreductase
MSDADGAAKDGMGEAAMMEPMGDTSTMDGGMSQMDEMGEMDKMGGSDGMNRMMRAVTQYELGGPEVLKVVRASVPDPGTGEILVRVLAASVNPIDAVSRESGTFVGDPPFVLGWDISGTVEAVGFGVTLFAPGDDVYGMLPFPQGHGAYSDFAVGPTRAFARKPGRLSHTEAAALPMVGLTAWQALVDTARVAEASRVLVNGAAGGIGHIAVQIAKARGAYVIGLASTAHLDFVRSLGADEVIDYTATDFTAAVSDVDAMLDVVGEGYPARALQVLKRGGILVSTQPPSLTAVADQAAERGVRLAGLLVEADRLGLTELAALANSGKVVPKVAATFPLEEAGAAQSDEHGPGKVVLTLA